MAIKKAQYTVTKATGEDVYHFETDNKMVNILDGDGVLVGTLDDMIFTGKTVTSGSYMNIKVNGLYKVTNLTGLPAGYDLDKISILSVKAVGKVGTPDLIIYDLYSQSGDIFHNTVISGEASGWTSGGTALENKTSSLGSSVGTLANLTTTVKTSIVGSINSLKSDLGVANTAITANANAITELKNHNHDSQYISRSGDTMTGDLKVRNNNKFATLKTTGEVISVAKLDALNKMTIGDPTVPLDILGNGAVTINGRKVWTEDSDGNGSGLDADKLGGVPNASFARKDIANSFSGTQTIDGEIVMSGSDAGKSTKLVWKDGTNLRGSIGFNQSGEFSILGNSSSVVFGSNSDMKTDGSIIISSEKRVTKLKFIRNSNELGIGMEQDRDTEDLFFYDWDNKRKGMTFIKSSGEMSFAKQILISGKRLFIQSGAPSGASAGDIWIQ